MQSLGVVHGIVVLLIVAVAIAAVVMFVRRSHGTASPPAVGPSGFGGWLLLLVILQTLAPLHKLAIIAQSQGGYAAMLSSRLHDAAAAVSTETGLYMVLAAIQLLVTVAMYRRSRHFPQLFLFQWIVGSLFIFIDAALLAATTGVPVGSILGPTDIVLEIGVTIVVGIWVLYVFRSVRARNTFVR